MKSLRVRLRAWRRWTVGVGLTVLAVLLLGLWYRQYAAENPAQGHISAREMPEREKSYGKPPSDVPDRPSRDRGARP
jgi:hypothetical protein